MPPQAPASSQPAQPNPAPAGHSFVSLYILAGAVVVAIVGALLWAGGFGSSSVLADKKVIGILSIPQVKEANLGFQEKLLQLGYENVEYLEYPIVPGATIVADTEKAVNELIAADVDLIFANFETQAKIAMDLLSKVGRSDVPVLFISRLHDPVKMGLVDSLQSSGNNATGVATNIIDLIQRHLEFIKQINPEAKRLGIFGKGFQVGALADEYYAEVKALAPKFGFEIVEYTTNEPPPNAKKEFDRIAATIKKGDIDAMMHIAGHFYVTQEAGESRLAIRLGIPMATNYEDIPRGGHFTYSNGTHESGGQAAVMADKIFRGTHPSEIPVEYAQRSILSIHLGRAREAGFTFPDSMLFLAENKYEDDSQFPPFEDR